MSSMADTTETPTTGTPTTGTPTTGTPTTGADIAWRASGEYSDIRYETTDDGMAKITICRPRCTTPSGRRP